MEANQKKAAYALGAIAIGLLRLFAGILLLVGQAAYAKDGSLYGFVWPRNAHALATDLQSTSLIICAAWLIQTGIWGTKTTGKMSPSSNRATGDSFRS